MRCPRHATSASVDVTGGLCGDGDGALRCIKGRGGRAPTALGTRSMGEASGWRRALGMLIPRAEGLLWYEMRVWSAGACGKSPWRGLSSSRPARAARARLCRDR